MEKYAIFGCGVKGKEIFEELGKDAIGCFIDNDSEKWGMFYKDIPIISLDNYIESKRSEKILIPVAQYYYEVKKQLANKGVEVFCIHRLYHKLVGESDVLVVNPYENRNDESDMYEECKSIENRILIKDYVNQLKYNVPLFNSIEIETYNRCNGVCSFCPVSVQNETRVEKKMTMELFKKIVRELNELNYDGNICLFSNNEPFLDDRIIDFQKYAKRILPDAYFYLYTNGTLLTMEKFISIIEYLDELIIDNYNQQLQLIPMVQKIVDYCESHDKLRRKVTVILRKPNEILTSRGGDSPNKKMNKVEFADDSCVFPFLQMIVRPDGKVSLCCNDPLGKYSLGDLNEQSIREVWYGEQYCNVRNKILSGRKELNKCSGCDVFLI